MGGFVYYPGFRGISREMVCEGFSEGDPLLEEDHLDTTHGHPGEVGDVLF